MACQLVIYVRWQICTLWKGGICSKHWCLLLPEMKEGRKEEREGGREGREGKEGEGKEGTEGGREEDCYWREGGSWHLFSAFSVSVALGGRYYYPHYTGAWMVYETSPHQEASKWQSWKLTWEGLCSDPLCSFYHPMLPFPWRIFFGLLPNKWFWPNFKYLS